jgi:hypothetical protein
MSADRTTLRALLRKAASMFDDQWASPEESALAAEIAEALGGKMDE